MNKNVRTYTFEGVPKRGDEWTKTARGEHVKTVRTKLYMRYLKKHMPEGTRIYENDNVVRFILPEPPKPPDEPIDPEYLDQLGGLF